MTLLSANQNAYIFRANDKYYYIQKHYNTPYFLAITHLFNMYISA